METTRLSTKGQLVLPKGLREARGWGPGTEFTVRETDAGVLLRPVLSVPETTIDEVVGCLRYKGKPLAIEEMDAAIADEVVNEFERGRH